MQISQTKNKIFSSKYPNQLVPLVVLLLSYSSDVFQLSNRMELGNLLVREIAKAVCVGEAEVHEMCVAIIGIDTNVTTRVVLDHLLCRRVVLLGVGRDLRTARAWHCKAAVVGRKGRSPRPRLQFP